MLSFKKEMNKSASKIKECVKQEKKEEAKKKENGDKKKEEHGDLIEELKE